MQSTGLMQSLLNYHGEGNGTPLQYSCLENPMDAGACQAAVHGVAKSWTQLSDFTSLFTLMHWRRKWQPTPVFLPRESQGWGSLMGCHLWGRTELDTTEATWRQHRCRGLFLGFLCCCIGLYFCFCASFPVLFVCVSPDTERASILDPRNAGFL